MDFFKVLPRFAQIGHMMENTNLLDDVDAIWAPLIEEAEARVHGQGELVTSGNLAEVNVALGKQAKLLVEMRRHTKHEVKQVSTRLFVSFYPFWLGSLTLSFQLTMQTVASKSPLGWAVVHKIEGTKDFDKEVIDLDGEEVRKVEKDLVAYNSECTVSNLFFLTFGWL